MISRSRCSEDAHADLGVLHRGAPVPIRSTALETVLQRSTPAHTAYSDNGVPTVPFLSATVYLLSATVTIHLSGTEAGQTIDFDHDDGRVDEDGE